MVVLFLFFSLLFSPFSQISHADDFKGKPLDSEITVGGQTGVGLLDGKAGFTIIGNIGKKIIDRGFAPDINNQVFIEGLFGPLFINGHTAFFYGAHLRWDFQKDEDWIFFATGGLGGNFAGSELDNRFDIYPRFSGGVFWLFNDQIRWRFDLSHEIITLGVSVGI